MNRVSVNVDQILAFLIIDNVGIMIYVGVNAKNDKSRDVGDYLDYENCKIIG